MAKKYRNSRSPKNNSAESKGARGRSRGRTDTRSKRYRDEDDSSTATQTGSLNDISWYSRNPQLLLAAGSFPYPYRPGMDMILARGMAPTNFTIPAVMSLDWIPSFGNSKYSTDPASVAGKELYGRVRAAYSGSLDADAPDFIVYLGALDSLFAYIGYLKRMYRCISVYTPENLALPSAVLRAMGLNEDLQSMLRRDKVRFWQGINELILQSRKFKCPAVMDIFNRHYWMSDNVYADAASLRAQLFMFNLRGVYKVEDQPEVSSAGSAYVAGLQMVPLPNNFVSLNAGAHTTVADHYVCDAFLDFGQDLIRALDAWDDSYTISGYLQRAYEGVQSFAVAELLQNEVMTAQFVPEVLTQIENSRTVVPPEIDDTVVEDMFDAITVSQNVLTNAVVSNVNMSYSFGTTAEKIPLSLRALKAILGHVFPFISLRTDAPTVADTVIASRLQPVVSYTVGTTTAPGTVSITVSGGTEVPLKWNLIRYDFQLASSGQGESYRVIPVPSIGLVDYNAKSQAITDDEKASPVVTNVLPSVLATVEQFDWHPISMMLTWEDNGPWVTPMGDIHNPTVTSDEMMENLHTVCFYSEFNSFGM